MNTHAYRIESTKNSIRYACVVMPVIATSMIGYSIIKKI